MNQWQREEMKYKIWTELDEEVTDNPCNSKDCKIFTISDFLNRDYN